MVIPAIRELNVRVCVESEKGGGAERPRERRAEGQVHANQRKFNLMKFDEREKRERGGERVCVH